MRAEYCLTIGDVPFNSWKTPFQGLSSYAVVFARFAVEMVRARQGGSNLTKAHIKKLLADQPFFADLDDSVLDLLAANGTEKALESEQVLFRYDEPASHFYLLQDGQIIIEVPAIEGPSLRVQCLEEGQILGWSWLIPPFRWSFQARTEAPTRVVEFDGKAIREQCEKDPQLGYLVLKRFASLMSERLDAARRKMIDEWNAPGFA